MQAEREMGLVSGLPPLAFSGERVVLLPDSACALPLLREAEQLVSTRS